MLSSSFLNNRKWFEMEDAFYWSHPFTSIRGTQAGMLSEGRFAKQNGPAGNHPIATALSGDEM
jgi:hypothetical protein